jgi:hypothetical protein
MKAAAIGLMLCALAAFTPTGAQDTFTPPDGQPPGEYYNSPEQKGQGLFGTGRYEQLDALVADYLKSDTRGPDGRQAIYLLTSALSEWFTYWGADQDSQMEGRLKSWQKNFPESAFQPIVAAMFAQSTAWRARGLGYSSEVTPEGWRLFRERNQKAWDTLMANKERSSGIPSWYEKAISIGTDLGVSHEKLQQLFEEGVRRHPGFYSIYFTYARQFAPRWGGDWQSIDAFIVEQSAAETNKEGDVLYARLYWLADELAGQPPDFFEDSKVDWRRMRRGFEGLMKSHPNGDRNQASFAAFACRRHDAATYRALRPKVKSRHFSEVAPSGISLEVCDARFFKKT